MGFENATIDIEPEKKEREEEKVEDGLRDYYGNKIYTAAEVSFGKPRVVSIIRPKKPLNGDRGAVETQVDADEYDDSKIIKAPSNFRQVQAEEMMSYETRNKYLDELSKSADETKENYFKSIEVLEEVQEEYKNYKSKNFITKLLRKLSSDNSEDENRLLSNILSAKNLLENKKRAYSEAYTKLETEKAELSPEEIRSNLEKIFSEYENTDIR